MSLRVWLPLDGDLRNLGCTNMKFTNSNAVINTSGKIGSCYSFNGSNAQIYAIHDKSIWNDKPISICMWYKFVAGNTTNCVVDIAADLCLSYVQNSSGLRFSYWRAYSNSSGTRTGDSNTISNYYDVNSWHHVVYVADHNLNQIYVDGIIASSFDSASKYTTNFKPLLGSSYNRITVGKSAGSSPFASGLVNDVRIYDHVLSAAEVKEISQGLILHYKLDGFQGGYGNKNLLAKYVVPGQAGPTSVANGGRTTWLGDYKITIPATENADTYFRLFMTEQLTSGTTYTISCKVSGLLSGSYYRFPLFAQGNTSMGVLNLDHNGLCSLTFTMNWTGTQTAATGANGETVYVNFLDDSARAIASGQGAITLYDFKLEKGSAATAWCPSDASLTQIQDSSGYNHNGTINSSPIISSETMRYGSSIMFDGVDDCIKIPFNDIIKDKNYTVSVWTYKTSIGTKNYQTILGGPSGFELEARSSSSTSPLYRIHNWGGGTTAYEFNKWNLFTFVHTDSNSKLYVNGELKITGTSANIPTGNYYIGAWNSVTGQNYEGLMSDFRIYCTALDADAIRQLYEVGAKVDNKQNLHTFELAEVNSGQELLNWNYTTSYGNHISPWNSFDTNGEITLTGGVSLGSDYIKINPSGKKYYFDADISVDANNQIYIGFQRYDASKTSRSNDATMYSIAVKPSTALVHQHYHVVYDTAAAITNESSNFGYFNSSTPVDTISVRILNDWSYANNRKITIHSLSLREVSTLDNNKINKKGQTISDLFVETINTRVQKGGSVESHEFIEL